MEKIVVDFSENGMIWNLKTELKQGENLAHEIVINLKDEWLGYKYFLIFQNNDNNAVTTPELQAENNQILYQITNALTQDAGVLKVELNITDDNGLLKKTHMVLLKITETLGDTGEIMPETYVPWYQQAVEQASIATQKANEVDVKLAALSISTWEDLLNLGEE